MEILNKIPDESVVTLGKFDCLHLGHKKLIEEAKKISQKKNIPLVAYTFSNVLKESIFSFEERLNMFESLGCDYVYVEEFNDEFKNLSPKDFFENKLIKILKAEHIVAGEDWRFGKDRAGDVLLLEKLCKEKNIGLTVIKKLFLEGKEVSSTLIKSFFDEGNIKKANFYLGKRYYIKGIVKEGKKLGRKLGFPTVNIELCDNLIYPKDGVYITEVEYMGKTYPSITNIGTNPTVNDETKRAETHIFDFCDDLYGENIKIYFCDFIREEIKFESTDILKEQIESDCTKCINFFKKITN